MTWEDFTDRLASVLRDFEDLVYLTVQVTDDSKVWFQAAIRAEGDDLLLHTTDSLPDEVAQELREAGWQPDEMDCLDRTIVWPASSATYRTAAEQLVRVLRSSPAATGPEALDEMGWRESSWTTNDLGEEVFTPNEPDRATPELGIRHR